MTEDDILTASASPAELERLYRADPERFTAVFPRAWSREPNSLVLSVWHERLASSATAAGGTQSTDGHPLAVTVVLSLTAGTLVKLPAFFGIAGEWYYPRFAVPLTVAALIGYFLTQHRKPIRLTSCVTLACLVCFVFLAILPDRPESDTLVLSLMSYKKGGQKSLRC